MLMQQVQHLGATEHHEIFNMISKHDVRYTQNNNGVFIDMSTLPNDLLVSVTNFVSYCYHNKGHLEDYNNRLTECKLNQNYERLPKSRQQSVAVGDRDVIVDDVQQGVSPESGGVDEAVKDEASHPTSAHPPPLHDFAALSSVSKRMTSSKLNQVKKRLTRKKNTSKVEVGGFLEREEYVIIESWKL